MPEFIKPEKRYLGDGAYADFDGEYVILTTEEDGPMNPRNRIFLERAVLAEFERYISDLRREILIYNESLEAKEPEAAS